MKKRPVTHKIVEHKPKPAENQGVVMAMCRACPMDYIGYCLATDGNKPVPCYRSKHHD
jgi:hypothetical protein